MEQGECSTVLIPPSNLIVNIGEKYVSVEDADNEVYDIYSGEIGSPSKRDVNLPGLGFVDTRKSVIEIEIELIDDRSDGGKDELSGPGKLPKSRNRQSHKTTIGKKSKVAEIHTVTAAISQDLDALRNRKGDTGSVIWRASLMLAEQALRQSFFPPFDVSTNLFNPSRLALSRVLELGGGTGVLAVLLHSLFASWTTTDQFENLKLIQKNLKLNHVSEDTTVRVEEIDWVRVQRDSENERVIQSPLKTDEQYDLVLAVDCIYNEALTKPLVKTLTRYTIPEKTACLVFVELRSSDVITAFLTDWLEEPDWTICRLGPDVLGPKLAHQFVAWVGWRSSTV